MEEAGIIRGYRVIIDEEQIRNLGMRSANEIMQAIMEYQYFLLSDEGKSRYLRRVEELNNVQD